MFIGLRIAGLILGVYGGIKAAQLGIGWLRHGMKKLKPPED